MTVIPEASPERLRKLSGPALDAEVVQAEFAIEVATESLKWLQDERHRRWYHEHVLRINETTTLA